jgi:glycosyltransferase involved in cell wall biosynthesis
MRVLLLTQHFAPEVTAGRFRVEAFADALAARGHEVEVICPVPNHPRGVIDEGYRGRPWIRRTVGGTRVTYLWVATTPRKTLATRLAYYGTYAAFAAVAGAFRRRPDLVIASSPPLSVAAMGTLLAIRHRAPLLLDIRDLWPHSPVAVGELKEGRLVRAMEGVERWVYSRADAIVTANDAFAAFIRERAPATARVESLPNGTTPVWLDAGERDVDRSQLDLPDDRFVWAYAGNVGLAHGLEHAAAAAMLLGEEFLLMVIGEGPRRSELEARVAEAPGLAQLRPLMPPTEAARHLRASDAVLVSERQPMTVSAKLYDSCAIGRPIVAACCGELRRLVEEGGIGIAVPHGDPEALAAAVRELRANPALRGRLSDRGRAFAREHLRERQAQRLANVAESVAPNGGSARR